MLAREKVVRRSHDTLTGIEPAGRPGIDDLVVLAPFRPLLDAAIDGLRDVLAGRKSGTEVLFPGGSQHLVEAVYRGDAMMDFYSGAVADVVLGWLRQPGDATKTVVEIGAGTGAATRFVLAGLQSRGLRVDYRFTDISRGFVERARRELGPHHPALRFDVLDIGRDPQAQGFAAGQADVVIASNVLHATADIETTIDHAKALLRPGGLLVINEVTAIQDYATLTFGLLDGWWAFGADDGRLDHAPLLSVPRWLDRLAAAGFRQARAFGLPGLADAAMPQAVIAAVSDGWIRQRAAPAQTADETVATPPLIVAPAGTRPRGARLCPLGGRHGARHGAGCGRSGHPARGLWAHSLIMMDAARRIETDLGGPVPPTLLIDHTTADALARWLTENRAAALHALLAPVAAAREPRDAPAAEQALALSSQQSWHWSLAQLMPDAPGLLAVPASFRLAAAIDRNRLQSAVDTIVARHATLRTVFIETPDGPRQLVRQRMAVPVASRRDETPFDLATGPLMRIALTEEAEGTWRLDLLFHHIIADLWSVGVFLGELSAAYAQRPLPSLARSYADHVAAEAVALTPSVLADRRAFWTAQLQDIAPALDLGGGTGNVDAAASSGQTRHDISADLAARLRAGAERMGRHPVHGAACRLRGAAAGRQRRAAAAARGADPQPRRRRQ